MTFVILGRTICAFCRKFCNGKGLVLKLGSLVAALLLCCNILRGYYGFTWCPTSRSDVLRFFPRTNGDGSRLTWAHSTNNRRSLREALQSNTMVLDADVSSATFGSSSAAIPVMSAHPPTTASDLTLDQWLSEVRQHRKAIKLNFKRLDAVEQSIHVLRRHLNEIDFPVVLNTDILQGPTNPISQPVDAGSFVRLSESLFDDHKGSGVLLLSLGWTTFMDPNVPHPNYTRAMIDEMIAAVAKPHHSGHVGRSSSTLHHEVTFSIRACIAKNSMSHLAHLLESVDRSTLTVWSSQGDPISTDDLMRFRRRFDVSRVFYDLSSPLREEFMQRIDQPDNGELERPPTPSEFRR